MNISLATLRFQPLLLFVVGVLMLLGIYSYLTLPAREDPKLTIREGLVTTAYPGLPADKVELLITKPLEEAINELPNIRDIRSTSTDGLSIIKPRFDFATPDLELAFEELAETVAETTPQLPEGAATPVITDDFGDIATMTLAIHGPDFGNAELASYAEHVRDKLILVPGTKKVELLGVRPERIFIEFENSVLSQSGVTPNDIASALRSENTIRPAGSLEMGIGSISVKSGGNFNTVDDVRSALIRASSGALIRLEDVATVTRAYEDPPQRLAYFNNDEAIILTVVMEEGLSVLNYSDVARAEVERLAGTLPAGLSLDIVTFEATKVATAVYGVSFNMLQTLAVVLGIVILFLGVRTGLIVGAIIPAVILATFAVMGLFQIPLQRMSLATIIISLGLLVDNGIVIAEDFKRRVQDLGDRDEALRQTSRELALPLLVSSLTTIVVFLPLLIANSDSTEYTRTISLVLTTALLVSYLFAMTVTTTLCHRFLEVPDKDAGEPAEEVQGRIALAFDHLTDFYAWSLKKVLRASWLYLGGMVLLLAAGGLVQSFVPREFFPSNNNPQVLVYLELPSGSTGNQTDASIRKITELIDDKESFPEIEGFAAYVGFGGPRFVLSLSPVDPAPNKGFLVINTEDLAGAEAIVPRLREVFMTQVPEVNTRVTRMFLGPEDPKVIRIQVYGPDANYINERAGDVMALLADEPGMIDIWSDWRSRTVELDLNVDQQAARVAGVTSSDIALSLQRQLDGEAVSTFRQDDESFPIVMRASADERSSVDRLRASTVYGARGETVPLGQVADLSVTGQWGFIQREDMDRTVTVEGRHLTKTPEDLAVEIQSKIDELNASMAPGHHVKIAGILEESSKNMAGLIATLPFIFALTFFLLILQFGDFRRPLVIFLSLPFASFGAFLGLLVMQSPFGFLGILSLFALFGIIINNSIVLVDRIDIERDAAALRAEENGDPQDASSVEERDLQAVITACRRRFRPIVMTTLTTVAGLLPLILARDVLFYGFSSALSAGLLVGTFVVSLGLTPVLYCLFFGIGGPPQTDPEDKGKANGQSLADRLAGVLSGLNRRSSP